jgi:glyoxylase I family protein
MDMTLRVEHIGLAATDPRGLADWYIRCLGGTELWSNGQVPPAVFVRLPGGCVLEIYKAHAALEGTAVNGNAGFRHMAFRVEDIEEARRELAARGVNFSEPVKAAGGGGHVLFFADAEGNLLHLVGRPDDAPLASL